MDYRRINTNQLYIMESATLVKIGISSDVVKRLRSLNANLLSQERFEIVKIKFYSSYFEARNAEKFLHMKYKYANIQTQYEGAKTECFCKSILKDVLKDFEEDGATYSFDPFIYVSKMDAEKVFGFTFLSVYKMIGQCGKHLKIINRALQNIAANIIMSKGRKIFYNKGVMNYVSPSSTWTPRLLEMFNWRRFTSLLPAEDLGIGVIRLFSMASPPIFLERYTKVTKGYLASIESIWDTSINKYMNTKYFKNLRYFVFC